MAIPDQKSPPRIVRVKDLPRTNGYNWVSESALRHMIFKATPRKSSKGESVETNGLFECGALIRIGRKVLIDLDRFDAWVSKHRQA